MSDARNTVDVDDLELQELFASLDTITASDDLKARTLDAIFGSLDEDEAEAKDENMATSPSRPYLRLVEDDPLPQKPAQEISLPTHKPRTRGWKLRVAAAIVAVAIGIGGGAAYATPVSHTQVSMGDSTVDLGVNVFGMTVSAQSEDDEGRDMLKKASVHNMRLKDSVQRLVDMREKDHGPDEDIRICAQDRNGQDEPIGDDVNRIIEEHNLRREQDKRLLQRTAPAEEPQQSQEDPYASPYQEQATPQQQYVQRDQPAQPDQPQNVSQPDPWATPDAQRQQEGQDMPSEQSDHDSWSQETMHVDHGNMQQENAATPEPGGGGITQPQPHDMGAASR